MRNRHNIELVTSFNILFYNNFTHACILHWKKT